MIQSINHKGLAALHRRGSSKGVQQNHVRKLHTILKKLDKARHPSDMGFPGSGLHRMTHVSEWAGFWSVKVNGNYRILFQWENGHARNVCYEDIHRGRP